MSWAATKTALNSTVGTENFKPLDKILRECIKTITTPQDKTFTENGTYEPDYGYDAFGTVTVAVPLEDATASGYDRTSTVKTNASYAAMGKITFNAYRADYSGEYIYNSFDVTTSETSKVVAHGMSPKPTMVFAFNNTHSLSSSSSSGITIDDTYIHFSKSALRSLGAIIGTTTIRYVACSN